MKWFEGNIQDAISIAKANQGIFTVYVYDQGDLSNLANKSLENEAVSNALSSQKYVCIKIENASADGKNFSQIYPVIVIPCLFFISGKSGVPIEVVGSFNPETLLEKLSKIEANHTVKQVAVSNIDSPNLERNASDVKVSESEASAINIPDKAASDSNISDKVANDSNIPDKAASDSNISDKVANDSNIPVNEASGNKISLKSEEKIKENTTEVDQSETKEEEVNKSPPQPQPPLRIIPDSENDAVAASDTASLDDKIDLAQKLVKKIQDEKTDEQNEKENISEVERRRIGHDMAKFKQKREDNERMELAKQRLKDKLSDQLARDKVKAQIIADRVERQAREDSLKEMPSQSPEVPPPMAASNSPIIRENNGITRIKFRFPTSTDSAQFPSTSTLGDIRNYLNQSPTLPFSAYELVTFMPRRTFTSEDDSKSLLDLQLSPSSIIIVKPVNKPSYDSIVPSGGGVTKLFWSFMSPLMVIFNYIGVFLGLRQQQRSHQRDSDEETEAPARKLPRTEGSYTTRHRPSSSYGQRRPQRTSKREGNVHRLNQDSSEDDENNTWNGNSTQQM